MYNLLLWLRTKKDTHSKKQQIDTIKIMTMITVRLTQKKKRKE